MSTTLVRVYFDFVDPLSYCVHHGARVRPEADAARATLDWVGFELRPPPSPLTEAHDPMWQVRWRAAHDRAAPMGLMLEPPRVMPWTRKAHELHHFAASHDRDEAIREAVFTAYFTESRDIGRVDVLVDLATAVGLDRTETKAVLDVDRHEEDVEEARRAALAEGVTDIPVLSLDGTLSEDFPDLVDLGTLLPRP